MKKKPVTYNEVFYQRNVDMNIDPDCHECTSHCFDAHGYPTVNRDGRKQLLHRYLYSRSTGESPEVVMHLCDNPKCINLNHLRAGNVICNVQDRTLKGRGRGQFTSEYNPRKRKES